MAVLNSWQKVSRVLTGKPFGDGISGAGTISADPNTRATILGTATQSTGTAGSTAFANGDLVFLYQTKGTGYGTSEWNSIASGGGTVNLTFSIPLQNTYSAGAQIIKVPRYTTASLSGFTGTAWNGSVGGISIILAKTSITIAGTTSLNGGNGGTGGTNGTGGGSGGGFRGGHMGIGGGSFGGYRGEGYSGTYGAIGKANEGNGGGGYDNGSDHGGGGGGNAVAGTQGWNTGGLGGAIGSSADLVTIMIPGGGGGGGTQDNAGDGAGAGGAGGGVFVLISKHIAYSSGGLTANGGAGGDRATWQTDGGSGAGGSILLICGTAILDTNKITANAGAVSGNVGVASTGVIAVHHSGVVTGTTSPTFTDVTDSTLKEVSLGSMLFFP